MHHQEYLPADVNSDYNSNETSLDPEFACPAPETGTNQTAISQVHE